MYASATTLRSHLQEGTLYNIFFLIQYPRSLYSQEPVDMRVSYSKIFYE